MLGWHKGDVLKVDGCVGINEAKRDGLFHARKDWSVVLMTDPFQASEHSCGVLSGSEGCIVMLKSRIRFKG